MILAFWGNVLKRDLLGETREEDKNHSRVQLNKDLEEKIKKGGEIVIKDSDCSQVKDLSDLFKGLCDNVKSLDLPGWKTSNVENMSGMFAYCENLKSLNLSGWDTSKVEDLSLMFANCKNLESLDLSNWDTSNVKDMIGIFDSCPAPYKVVNQIIKK